MVGDAVTVGVFLERLVRTIACESMRMAPLTLTRIDGILQVGQSPAPAVLPGCFFLKAGTTLWLCYLFLVAFETGELSSVTRVSVDLRWM